MVCCIMKKEAGVVFHIKILKIHHIHNNIHNISKYILKILNNLTSNAYMMCGLSLSQISLRS